jgi:hypothetical protein
MFRMKPAILGALAALAISAAASASASAATHAFWDCQKIGGPWKNAQCSEKGPPNEWGTREIAETKAEGTGTASTLASTIAGLKITVECKKNRFSATLEKEGKSKGEVTFEECKMVGSEFAACEVPNIKFNFKDKLVAGPEDEFEPTSGTTFVEIRIDSCALKGTYPAKGTQICKLPNAGQAKIVHELECTPAGSSLTLGKEKAEFTSTEKVHLVSEADWGAV